MEDIFKSSLCCIKSLSFTQRASFSSGDEKPPKESSVALQPTAGLRREEEEAWGKKGWQVREACLLK